MIFDAAVWAGSTRRGRCFTDDLDALLAIHRVPVRLRIWVRTTDERVKWQLVRTSPVSLPAVA